MKHDLVLKCFGPILVVEPYTAQGLSFVRDSLAAFLASNGVHGVTITDGDTARAVELFERVKASGLRWLVSDVESGRRLEAAANA